MKLRNVESFHSTSFGAQTLVLNFSEDISRPYDGTQLTLMLTDKEALRVYKYIGDNFNIEKT